MNLTFISLNLAQSFIRSPFINLPMRGSQHNYLTISKASFDHHFSSFFQASIINPINSQFSFTLASSKMSNFLNHVVRITSDDTHPIINIPGKNNSKNTPAASPTSSFICQNVVFQRNIIEEDTLIPQDSTCGAAIFVSLTNPIVAQINNSYFSANKATFGGAIFFVSFGGELVINTSVFSNNEGYGGGSHFFIGSNKKFTLYNLNLLGSVGPSTILITHCTENKATISYIRFFQNSGPIMFNDQFEIAFENCCFVKFEGVGTNTTYVPNGIISSTSSSTTFSFTTCCINYGTLDGKTGVTVSQLDSVFSEAQKNTTQMCEGCRLVPFPTPTMHPKVSMLCAKEAIIAICLCVLISIIGVLVIVGVSDSRAKRNSHENDVLINVNQRAEYQDEPQQPQPASSRQNPQQPQPASSRQNPQPVQPTPTRPNQQTAQPKSQSNPPPSNQANQSRPTGKKQDGRQKSDDIRESANFDNESSKRPNLSTETSTGVGST